MILENKTWTGYKHSYSNRISHSSYRSWTSASSLLGTYGTSHFRAFRLKEFHLACAMVGDEVISILTKMSWTFSLQEVWWALQPAPLLKFRICLFHASRTLSEQTAIGFPASMANNSQLWVSIWWTEGLILAQGKCNAKWSIASWQWILTFSMLTVFDVSTHSDTVRQTFNWLRKMP